jgi:ankyrin repeat protein
MRSDVFSHILAHSLSSFVINEVDTFGNSGVHIAAACKHPSNLLALKEERPWSREPNNAGQTFLHVIQDPSPSNHKDICTLLEWLSEVKFDFTVRDHHGQTALHLLTRPWLHGESVSKVLEVLFDSKIMIPTYRDNLGYTIKEQIEQTGYELDFAQARLLAKTTKSTPLEEYSLPNFGKNTAIETVEDLVVYAHHAELLRDIRHSINNPLHEDASGCNGLHCLAEVCLDLPLPEDSVSLEAEPTPGIPQTQRERYLEGLLKSGVDANNHDKQGYTPLMAFVIHHRAGEDDALTTRLLQRLFDANAGINIRDRQGETPLHLAVKLGRRAATKFLLSHGANVHARDGDGLGVIALGERASKEAKHDEILYGQIMLCVSLVVTAGGLSNPTILQEWGSPQWKIFD